MAVDTQKSRLWIVSELYYPELTSTGYYITAIAESLASEADVWVICGQPNYSARGQLAKKNEERNNVKIARVWGLRLDKNVIVFRLLNMLTLSLAVLIKSLTSFKSGDTVLVTTTPPVLPIVAALAALMRGGGYTILIHDVYPEELYATGILRKGSVLSTLIELVQRWSYKHASSLICVGRDMKELLEKKIGDLNVPIFFIPNWGETDEIKPEPREQNRLLKELGLEDNFVILYAGNFGRPNDLETIASAAKSLRGEQKVQFLFIGAGAREKWLREVTADLSNVLILPPMPRSEQQLFLNACDVAIASLVNGMWGAAVPSRIYNYLAAGKPILAICEPGSEMARLLDEDHVGKWVKPDDADGFVQAIREILDSPETLSLMGRNARASAVNKYSPAAVLPTFREVLINTKIVRGDSTVR
ncbi:MAG: glycosyltransferase family 4 protein [Pyrinomonadaceae bacterium]